MDRSESLMIANPAASRMVSPILIDPLLAL